VNIPNFVQIGKKFVDGRPERPADEH